MFKQNEVDEWVEAVGADADRIKANNKNRSL